MGDGSTSGVFVMIEGGGGAAISPYDVESGGIGGIGVRRSVGAPPNVLYTKG